MRIPRGHRPFIGIAVLSAVLGCGVCTVLCGNPQWSKYIYLAQWKVYGQEPAIPDDYTGLWCEWYEDGSLRRKVEVLQGEWQGSFEEWSPSGTLMLRVSKEDDHTHETYYSEDGVKEAEAEMLVENGRTTKIHREFSGNALVSTRKRIWDADNVLISDETEPSAPTNSPPPPSPPKD